MPIRRRDRRTRSYYILLILIVSTASIPQPGWSTDLYYNLMSPSFGGNAQAPFQYSQYEKSLRDQRAAAAAAAARATAAPDPTQQFANAILSQLNSLVAREVALKIANSQAGDAGTIESGNVSVTYVNADGQLDIVITTPTGSTTLSLPTGG